MSRDKAIAQLLKVFRQYGYEGATLTRLSEATGLGKASLYHYFPKGKEEMAAAVLNHTNDWLAKNIISPLQGSGEPTDRIRAMSKNVDEFYNRGQQGCLLAALSLGESKDLFHTQIQNALNVWINTLAQVLIDAGLVPELARYKAEDAILQIQGALVLARGLNDTAPFERVINRLPEELLKA
jgi:AcrR family transcriptional regulator